MIIVFKQSLSFCNNNLFSNELKSVKVKNHTNNTTLEECRRVSLASGKSPTTGYLVLKETFVLFLSEKPVMQNKWMREIFCNLIFS